VRGTPIREGIVVAPADDRILDVTQVLRQPNSVSRQACRAVSIFMSRAFNCHVPQSGRGRIDRILSAGHLYQCRTGQGQRDNERNSLVISTGMDALA